MTSLFDPVTFARGPAMKNRFMLAPLTNCQSHPDGRLSDEEFHWLVMRAKGGFGLTMTCAAHVQARGQGFPGQLGAFSDIHLPGLTRLAAAIKAHGGLAVVQLHHAGMRSDASLVKDLVSASEDAATGARALTTDEVSQLRDDFIAAALRCERAGFDGVEIHGAHGYVLTQFLSAETNRRTDRYGGSLENRERLVLEIIEGIRAQCRADFNFGIRLSPERYGVKLGEIVPLAQRLMRDGRLDYIDMSLWDAFKEPEEAEFKGRTLASYFTELDRGATRLAAAGKINTGEKAQAALDAGFDFIAVGRGAILHHDFPRRVEADAKFLPINLPVSAAYLRDEGLSDVFVKYMSNWKNFVAA
ncbi:MAG: NADH:flavin oxidoreductase [Caulobacterales bacterium]